MENSIICSNVIIEKGVIVKSGSILSFGVHVKPNVEIVEGTTASKLEFDAASNGYVTAEEAESALYQTGVNCFIPNDCQLRDTEKLGSKSFQQIRDEEDESDYDYDDEMEDEPEGARRADGGEEEIGMSFYQEIADTFRKCHRTGTKQINFSVEINSLKMAQNMTYSDCIYGFYGEIMNLVKETDGFAEMTMKDKAEAVNQELLSWKELLTIYLKDTGEQHALIHAVEIYCM